MCATQKLTENNSNKFHKYIMIFKYTDVLEDNNKNVFNRTPVQLWRIIIIKIITMKQYF